MKDSKKSELKSCEPTMSRQEFFQATITRAKAAGVLLMAPVIAETFFVPAAFAATSNCDVSSTNGGSNFDTASAHDYTTDVPTIDGATTPGHVESSCTGLQADTAISGDPTPNPGKSLCFRIKC
jgi:hypothetical protein